jgi:hypothetical protein
MQENKQTEVFLVRGKKYIIEKDRLVRDSHSSWWFLPEVAPKLIEIGGMYYYRLSGDCYILYHYARYPCFDSYDRMHENRYFRAYYICRSLAEVQEKHSYLTLGKLFIADLNPSEKYRSPLYPYVYYDEDKNLLEIYEEKTEGR